MLRNIFVRVAAILALLSMASNVAAQTLDSDGRPVPPASYEAAAHSAPASAANPDVSGLPEAVLVADGHRGFDGYPIAAAPGTIQDLSRLSRENYFRYYGYSEASIENYRSLSDQTGKNCRLAAEWFSDLLEGMSLIARTDPIEGKVFEQWRVDYRNAVHTAKATRRFANIFQGIFGIVEAIFTPPPTGIAYGGTVLTGAISNETTGHANDVAEGITRRSGMANAIDSQTWSRMMLLWGSQDRWWVERVMPECDQDYNGQIQVDAAHMPRLSFEPVERELNQLEHDR